MPRCLGLPNPIALWVQMADSPFPSQAVRLVFASLGLGCLAGWGTAHSFPAFPLSRGSGELAALVGAS